MGTLPRKMDLTWSDEESHCSYICKLILLWGATCVYQSYSQARISGTQGRLTTELGFTSDHDYTKL